MIEENVRGGMHNSLTMRSTKKDTGTGSSGRINMLSIYHAKNPNRKILKRVFRNAMEKNGEKTGASCVVRFCVFGANFVSVLIST